MLSKREAGRMLSSHVVVPLGAHKKGCDRYERAPQIFCKRQFGVHATCVEVVVISRLTRIAEITQSSTPHLRSQHKRVTVFTLSGSDSCAFPQFPRPNKTLEPEFPSAPCPPFMNGTDMSKFTQGSYLGQQAFDKSH